MTLLATPAPESRDEEECQCPEHGRWYGAAEIDKMVREIDVAMNGDGAARQAKLVDIVGQVKALAEVKAKIADLVPKSGSNLTWSNGFKTAVMCALRAFPK